VCGINALFSYITNVRDVDERELLATREAMRSRGPDAGGAWISDDRRVGLAHRRLSIIDTGERANQPMFTADRALAIVFNGEIYNYRELRAELARGGAAFQTTSDTEVLLELYRRDGDAMFDRMRGMYAFALWDARTRTMLLGRDPYGIKPLYYATEGGVLRVASQVRALVAGGGVSLARDSAGICGFLLRGSVPEPFTTYAAIRALPAGTSMRVSAAGVEEPRRHFSLAATLRDAVRQRVDVGDEQRRAMICDAVQQSVRDHLVADVPIGAFLSAGRDSGTIVGLAAENGPPLQTVTLRFDEYAGTAKDEAPLASLVARHYGTEHFTNTLDEATFREELPRALAAMDQPSIDGLNSYFVCRAAAQLGWKVALSGTGGDELFGGYSTFRTIPRTARTYRRCGRRDARGDVPAHQRSLQSEERLDAEVRALIRRRVPAEARPLSAARAGGDRRRGVRARCVAAARHQRPDAGRHHARSRNAVRARRRARVGTLHAQPAAARSRLGEHGAFAGSARAARRRVPAAPDRATRRQRAAPRRQTDARARAASATAGSDHDAPENGLHAPDEEVAAGRRRGVGVRVRHAQLGAPPHPRDASVKNFCVTARTLTRRAAQVIASTRRPQRSRV
jgi:asparagine synthase (glutamine-hydrolysing)